MAMEPEAEEEETTPTDFGEAAEVSFHCFSTDLRVFLVIFDCFGQADGEWEEPQFDPKAAEVTLTRIYTPK